MGGSRITEGRACCKTRSARADSTTESPLPARTMIAIRSRAAHQIRRPRGLATADVP